MTTTILPSAADPVSAGLFQRAPESELPYGFWKRFADRFAGWRDRRVVTILDGEAASPWLQCLQFECLNRLEAERRTAQTALAQLDHAIIAESERVVAAETARLELLDASARLNAQELSDAAITPAEAGDDPAVRLQRRQRARVPELARLTAQADQQASVAQAAKVAIKTLIGARHSHWAVLQVRGSHLIAHYHRRAATYVRSATRTLGEPVRTPLVPEPAWLGNSVPPTPSTVGEEA